MIPEVADEARAVTLAIAREVSDVVLDPSLGPAKTVDLAHGKAGRAVFFHHLARTTGDPSFTNRSSELLAEAVRAVSETSLFPSLLYGFTGIAWAHQHLAGDPDVVDEIDDALLQHISTDPWTGRCDLAVGLTGYGVYFLRRPPSAVVDEALERIEHHLIASSKSDDRHVWWSPPSWIATQSIELGISGVGGIASYLASAWPRLGPRAQTLLPKALSWIWDHLDLTLRDDTSAPRVRWCEPGIAMALLRAARRLGSETWWERGLVLARNLARTSVVDPSFYHGAAGIAHMLHRVYRATADHTFEDAARDWYKRLLSMRTAGTGIAGYTVHSPDTGELMAYPGILLGAAGIGLVLLSAWADVEPTWDFAFQFDLPII